MGNVLSEDKKHQLLALGDSAGHCGASKKPRRSVGKPRVPIEKRPEFPSQSGRPRVWPPKPDAPVYRNGRRIRGARGKRLLRRRGERVERPFAHLYRTGRLRRLHVRRHANIRKRMLIHAGAYNCGQLLRALIGVGTPRGLQGRLTVVLTRDRLRAERESDRRRNHGAFSCAFGSPEPTPRGSRRETPLSEHDYLPVRAA